LACDIALADPSTRRMGSKVKSNISLSQYFANRLQGAAAGVPFNDSITFNKSGPVNNAAPLYDWDKNNFQPRIAFAWTPKFQNGILGKLLGTREQSVFRGGFGITNDAYGQQLAVSFDLTNAVGFVSNFTTSANTYCTSSATCAAPRFTGFGQPVRGLPGVVLPANLNFPASNQRMVRGASSPRLIQSSLLQQTTPGTLHTNVNYRMDWWCRRHTSEDMQHN